MGKVLLIAAAAGVAYVLATRSERGSFLSLAGVTAHIGPKGPTAGEKAADDLCEAACAGNAKCVEYCKEYAILPDLVESVVDWWTNAKADCDSFKSGYYASLDPMVRRGSLEQAKAMGCEWAKGL